MTDDVLTAALVAELAKKTSVSWLRVPGEARAHPVWHSWHEDALCVVSDGDEQPLPHDGMDDGDLVEVVLRSKDNGGRLVTWVGRVSVLQPDDESWTPVTDSLIASRVNTRDLATAADEWAERAVVRRIAPTGEFLESPGDLSDDAHRAAPLETPAITRGRLPRVLHRRVKRHPRLS